mgnify:CR=1 FL=1
MSRIETPQAVRGTQDIFGAEAEAFAASFADEAPNIVSAEIPGKGIWYRVRFGAYTAFKDAVAAKMAFEKRHNKIALVVGPL